MDSYKIFFANNQWNIIGIAVLTLLVMGFGWQFMNGPTIVGPPLTPAG